MTTMSTEQPPITHEQLMAALATASRYLDEKRERQERESSRK